eukprot:4053705-Pyramimonas_sp.AAC.1
MGRQSGGADDYVSRSGQRSFRLVDAYERSVENEFSNNVKQLRQSDPWDAMPFPSRTLSLRTRIFVTLSRSGALNHKLADHKSNYPYKCIAAVSHPELEDDIIAGAACPRRLDRGTRA